MYIYIYIYLGLLLPFHLNDTRERQLDNLYHPNRNPHIHLLMMAFIIIIIQTTYMMKETQKSEGFDVCTSRELDDDEDNEDADDRGLEGIR